MYSKEDGTPAAKLKEQIHPATKKSRYNKIMKLQQEIANESLSKYINKDIDILIEAKTFDSKYYVGRTENDVPDMDGIVYVKNTKKLDIGEFIKCKIIGKQDYDLQAEIVDKS